MESPSIARSFKSVFHSVGRQHEKPLKQAFYNTAALGFLALSLVVGVSAYYVLEAFLRPLIWAALCGTFLFPFKKASATIVHDWLTDLETRERPFVVGVAILPYDLMKKVIHTLETTAKSNWKLLVTLLVSFTLFYGLLIFHPFQQILNTIDFAINIIVQVDGVFVCPIAVWSIVVAYIIFLIFWKKLPVDHSSPSLIEKGFSVAVWIMGIFYLLSLTRSWKFPITIFLGLLIGLGVSGLKKPKKEKKSGIEKLKSKITVKLIVDNTLNVFGIQTKKAGQSSTSASLSKQNNTDSSPQSTDAEKEVVNSDCLFQSKSASNSADQLNDPPKVKPNINLKKKKKKRVNRSDPYFIALFWLFTISFFWANLWLTEFFVLFLLLKYILKLLFSVKLECMQCIHDKATNLSSMLHTFYLERKEIIFPSPVTQVLSMLHVGDQKMISFMNAAIDKIMAMMMIFFLGMLLVIGTAFFAFQVQHESSYLVTVATNVVNKTIISNQDNLRWLNLNDSDIKKTLDSTIHSGYIVAREKMAQYVSSAVTSKEANTTYMEHQITQVIDQLYEAWVDQKGNLAKDSSAAKLRSPNNVSMNATQNRNLLSSMWYRLTKLASSSDYRKIFEIFKENVHTLFSVLDSIWQLLRGNINLMFSIITHIFSILVFSGSYILNILIALIIFATTLFYLLSNSSDEYMLLELFSGLSMGTRLGESITNAIQDVFGASLKMATFYFFFTWLTHYGLGANLIFIPAAFAAMLGVVPFIGTYWAAVPAALELWLIQQKGVLSILLIVLHFLPTYVVDTAIYSEIGEGGHPYLTGLAVAGGVYCFGLEGAFFGPFILCCAIAAFDIYNSIMNSTDGRDKYGNSPTKGEFSRSFSEFH